MKKIDLKKLDDMYTPFRDELLAIKINELISKINRLEKELKRLSETVDET